MGFADFLRWRTAPAETITRAAVAPLDLRSASAQLHVSHTVGSPQWPRRDPATYELDAYRKLALIFRCVNVLSSAIAEAPLKVLNPDGEDDETHSLRQLINLPNRDMGEAQFWYTVALRMSVYGFCVVEKERGLGRMPVALWPMNSEWLKPIPRNQAAHDWEYTVPGHRPVTIEADDVAVFRFADTGTGDPRGIGPVEVALREFGVLNKMQDFLKGFFDAGSLPVYGLVLDPEADFTEEEADLIRAKWVERTSWRGGEPPTPPVMQSVKDIKRLSFDMNELAYVDLRDLSEIAICQAFGIPGAMIGQRFAHERSIESNYEQSRKSFYEDTISKHWVRFDDVVTRQLLPEFEYRPGWTVKFDTDEVDALQEDQVAKRKEIMEAAGRGLVTRADYKRAAGLDVLPGDEVYLLPFNVVEVPATANGAQRATSRVTGASVQVSHNAQVQALPADTSSQFSRLSCRRLDGGRRLVSLETRALIEQRAARVYTNAARRFGPVFYRYFQDQKDRVLAALNERAAAGPLETRDIADVISIDWASEADELDPLIRQLWDLMGETATGQTVELLGLGESALTWDVANPWVRQVMSGVAERVTMVSETTKRDIARVVTDALTEGTSIPDLADKLRGMYEESYKSRSETIARTESQYSFNTAQVEASREGGVSEMELLDNPAHDSDPGSDGLTCAQRNGLIVPVDQVSRHIAAEHPNGSLAVAPVVRLGEV